MHLRRFAPLAALLILASCSSSPGPETKKKPVEPPKPVSGLSAIFKMYQVARTWAPDAMPYKMQSVNLESVKSEDGKAGAWTATFVSESRRKQRSYSFSAIEGEGFHKDVFAQQEESFMGATPQARPFRIEALRADTTKAYEVAVKKSVEYMKKNPGMTTFITLDYGDRFPNPAWRVLWGQSVSTSGYSIFVDTVTGEFLQTGR